MECYILSVRILVILGCGATVDDPNLKGFMSFASKQLHLNIPYFYLHKAGDDLSDLGPNVIPVCYGMEYSDLSNAVEDMANYRIRSRYAKAADEAKKAEAESVVKRLLASGVSADEILEKLK